MEECAAFHEIFSRFVSDCATQSELEAQGVVLLEAEDMRRWTSLKWQETLFRVSRTPANTPPGTLAKGGVLRDYLAERPSDDPCGTDLVLSILTDLERLLG